MGIRATRTREVLGDKGRRIRELTALVQKRYGFPENSVELFAERVENRAANAMAQAESLRYKLIGGLAVRRACYGVVRFIMENGCTGCEVVVSGKLRAQRAKAMKFKDGYLISTGDPKNYYIDEAVRHVAMRQGMLGVRVKIILKHDPEGKTGPKKPMPDLVIVHEQSLKQPLFKKRRRLTLMWILPLPAAMMVPVAATLPVAHTVPVTDTPQVATVQVATVAATMLVAMDILPTRLTLRVMAAMGVWVAVTLQNRPLTEGTGKASFFML